MNYEMEVEELSTIICTKLRDEIKLLVKGRIYVSVNRNDDTNLYISIKNGEHVYETRFVNYLAYAVLGYSWKVLAKEIALEFKKTVLHDCFY